MDTRQLTQFNSGATICDAGDIVRLLRLLDFREEAIVCIDDSHRIVALNQGAENLFGYCYKEMKGMNILSLSPARFQQIHKKLFFEFDNPVHPAIPQRNCRDIIALHRNGREFPARYSLCRYTHDDQRYYAFIFRDITTQRALETRLKHQANHDPLTGLPNRLLFVTLLENAIERVNRHKSQLSLLYLDLDNFKPINDHYGHLFGDQCLKEVSCRLQRSVRRSDTVTRMGGDEFAVLLEDIATIDQANDVVAKIHDFLQRPIRIGNDTVKISASIGITLYPDISIAADANDLIDHAYKAMYAKKKESLQKSGHGNRIRKTVEYRQSPRRRIDMDVDIYRHGTHLRKFRIQDINRTGLFLAHGPALLSRGQILGLHFIFEKSFIRRTFIVKARVIYSKSDGSGLVYDHDPDDPMLVELNDLISTAGNEVIQQDIAVNH